LEEYESTEDPDMDRTAMEDVRGKKAPRKNVLVTDALNVIGLFDIFFHSMVVCGILKEGEKSWDIPDNASFHKSKKTRDLIESK
jgi:hypothetical protein